MLNVCSTCNFFYFLVFYFHLKICTYQQISVHLFLFSNIYILALVVYKTDCLLITLILC